MYLQYFFQDEYVTKPLRFPELIAAIKKFAPQSAHMMAGGKSKLLTDK